MSDTPTTAPLPDTLQLEERLRLIREAHSEHVCLGVCESCRTLQETERALASLRAELEATRQERDRLQEMERQLWWPKTLLQRAEAAEQERDNLREERKQYPLLNLVGRRAEVAEAQVAALTRERDNLLAQSQESRRFAMLRERDSLRKDKAALTTRVQQLETALKEALDGWADAAKYKGTIYDLSVSGTERIAELRAALVSDGRSTPPAEGHG